MLLGQLKRKLNKDEMLKGAEVPDSHFNAAQLAIGIKIEMEHTNNPETAKAIAKAHLLEIDDYYTRLIQMERKAKAEDSQIKSIVNFKGLTIMIENPVGSVREGIDSEGNEWKTKFLYPYGYIYNTKGADGDGVDCFLGNDITSERVFIIHQTLGHGGFDEDKVMLGFSNREQARDAYLAHYNTQGFLGEITEMPMFEFRLLVKQIKGKKIV